MCDEHAGLGTAQSSGLNRKKDVCRRVSVLSQ